MKRNQILYLTGGLIILVAILRLCSHHEEEPKFTPRDYPEIIDSGILRAVTEYNTISYHADKDSLSGFDYELLNVFAQAKNLRLAFTSQRVQFSLNPTSPSSFLPTTLIQCFITSPKDS